MEAQQSCNALQWTNLNTEEACLGQKVCDHSKAAAIKLRTRCKPISNSIHSWRHIALKCDQLFQHYALTSTTLWSADKLSRGEAKWTDLLANSISIELSAAHQGCRPYSSGPLAPSQISGLHFIRLELIVDQLTRTWLKGPITMDGKAGPMYYGLLLWLSIHNDSEKLSRLCCLKTNIKLWRERNTNNIANIYRYQFKTVLTEFKILNKLMACKHLPLFASLYHWFGIQPKNFPNCR